MLKYLLLQFIWKMKYDSPSQVGTETVKIIDLNGITLAIFGTLQVIFKINHYIYCYPVGEVH